jgi:hypothetical protein
MAKILDFKKSFLIIYGKLWSVNIGVRHVHKTKKAYNENIYVGSDPENPSDFETYICNMPKKVLSDYNWTNKYKLKLSQTWT